MILETFKNYSLVYFTSRHDLRRIHSVRELETIAASAQRAWREYVQVFLGFVLTKKNIAIYIVVRS